MKKKIYSTLIVCLVLFSSVGLFGGCTGTIENTQVEITVKELLSVPAAEKTVYMFSHPSDHEKGRDPKDAKKYVVTDEKGVALFSLNDLKDLNFFESQTTFYFTVFKKKQDDDAYEVDGSVGLTIKRGTFTKKDLILGATP